MPKILFFRIVTQPRLPWWPQIDLVYVRSGELRALFTDTLNKATQGYIAHTPLRMITSLTLKSKDAQNRLTRPDEGPAHKALLLLMVRLIHADPMLLLNVCTPCTSIFNLFLKYIFILESRKGWTRGTKFNVRTNKWISEFGASTNDARCSPRSYGSFASTSFTR